MYSGCLSVLDTNEHVMRVLHKNAKMAACAKGGRNTEEQAKISSWKNQELLIIEVFFDKVFGT